MVKRRIKNCISKYIILPTKKIYMNKDWTETKMMTVALLGGRIILFSL